MDQHTGEPLSEERIVYAEKAESRPEEISGDELRALALAYAKYLADTGAEPGDPTFTDSVPDEVQPEESAEQNLEIAEKAEEPAHEATSDNNTSNKVKKKSKKKKNKSRKERKSLYRIDEPTAEELAGIEKSMDKTTAGRNAVAAVLDKHDRLQDGLDSALARTGREFVKASHKITSTYRNSRRVIGVAILATGIIAAVILAVFDRYTVYEYSYNGMSLGYVRSQEDVTDVLDIAGTMLTANSSGDTEIKFVANQNVTFNPVDARDKSTDSSDVAVNKLVYMTDIETEAYGVYDGEELEAIVKSSEDAENLLNQTRASLSQPDEGMDLISSEFTNDLDIRPVNVLLTSVQSNSEAMELMTQGGRMEIYHIVEEGESAKDLMTTFGVDELNIFNEDNTEPAVDISQGDKVCIHAEISPVSVEMVEKGRMREIIEYETVKKDSDDYYKGDTYTEQEGVDGIQIFEGTVTKVAGEVTKRDGDTETIREKQDKIILIGTAERPKTAPTGTYAMPIQRYTLSSNFGYRWGRLHSGIDMAAPTGTLIFATDGGTVIRSGWYGGYGQCIDIQHESGRVTRYGHCSRLLVSVGDKVYQGQNIALVGNTGHSFGSHLHFEIILGGSPVNPRPYLGI